MVTHRSRRMKGIRMRMLKPKEIMDMMKEAPIAITRSVRQRKMSMKMSPRERSTLKQQR